LRRFGDRGAAAGKIPKANLHYSNLYISSRKHVKPTVLLIEEHAKLRRTLSQAIELAVGAHVVAVGSVREAAGVSATESFELTVVGLAHADDMMPLVRSLKKAWPSRSIIGLSPAGNIDAAWLAGCDDVLEQPFGLEELRSRLAPWVRKMGHLP
jgi:DNA-binding response OmpR family regulator